MKEFLEKQSTLTRFPNQNNTVFTLCDCKSEVLVIDYDKDVELADFAIYKSSYNGMSFWQKMGHIWHILTKGCPYSDQIVLNTKQLKEIKQFIEQII